MKEKLKQILARFVFSLYHKKILKNRISVNSIEETVEHLVKSEDSLVRFGDGEIKLMAGKEIPFQKPDPALAERLKDILQTKEAGLSVALPDIFEDVSAYVEKSQSFWMEHLLFHRREYNRYCCVRVYENAFFSRPYIMYRNKTESAELFRRMKQIWENQKIVFVEGDISHNGVDVDLFENEAFSLAVRNLFHLWAIIVPVNLVIGIFIAEVYIKLRKEKLCLFFLVPSILPAACVVTIASSILQKSPSQWGETPVAFYVFLIIVLWKTLGFSILIFIVAIKSIESEIIDAAMLDGVNPLQCFWYIKLPIIKNSLLICGILTIYNSFRCFREAYLIGGSHPNEQLYSIQHFLQNNFMNMNYARLEAASILVVLFVGAFVLIGMYLAKKRNNR